MSRGSVKRLVIRPVDSTRGLSALLTLALLGILSAGMGLFVYMISPRRDPGAATLITILCAVSAILIVVGTALYLALPKVIIVFDATARQAAIKAGAKGNSAIPFSELRPFQVHEMLRGYAHQFYCRNESFGEYADLFFSATYGTTLRKAQKLARLSGTTVIRQ